jgi:hypothetical protein
MKLDKTAYIEEFLEKLHANEYIIDSKANEIQYDDMKTVAGALEFALSNYNYVTQNSLLSTYPDSIDNAYRMITAAFTYGVIINKHDIRTKLRRTEELLTHCEDEKDRLEKDNNELRERLINCERIKETIQEQLLSYSQSDREDET